MKKSLVALAVLAATGAYAQSSVTIYGVVEATTDLGFNQRVESTTISQGRTAAGVVQATSPAFAAPALSATTGALVLGTAINSGSIVVRNERKNGFRIQDGNSQGVGTSRVGFRGTEDLGGGLKANFQLEMGIRVDDGCVTSDTLALNKVGCSSGDSGGNLFGRNAWGGVSGGFGEVRLGRQLLGSFSAQANSWAAGSSSGLYDAAASTAPGMGGVRFSNAIRYMSPTMGGFKASVMLSAPETEADTSTSNVTTANGGLGVVTTGGTSRRTGVDLALEFANGPVYVGFGYNVRDAANSTSGVAPIGVVGANIANGGSPTGGKINAWTLGGSYDLGVVKPFINYTRQNTESNRRDTFSPAAGGFAATVGNNNDENARAWSVGLRAPVGAITVIAGIGTGRTSGVRTVVGTQNIVGGSEVSTITTRVDQRRDAFQLGAVYALSKRTSLSANYGQNKLRSNTDATSVNNFAAASGTQSIRATDRVSAINVGLRHAF